MSISTLTNLTTPAGTSGSRGAAATDLAGLDRRRSDAADHDGFDAHFARELRGRDQRGERDDGSSARDERTDANVQAPRERSVHGRREMPAGHRAIGRSNMDDASPADRATDAANSNDMSSTEGSEGVTRSESAEGVDDWSDVTESIDGSVTQAVVASPVAAVALDVVPLTGLSMVPGTEAAGAEIGDVASDAPAEHAGPSQPVSAVVSSSAPTAALDAPATTVTSGEQPSPGTSVDEPEVARGVEATAASTATTISTAAQTASDAVASGEVTDGAGGTDGVDFSGAATRVDRASGGGDQTAVGVRTAQSHTGAEDAMPSSATTSVAVMAVGAVSRGTEGERADAGPSSQGAVTPSGTAATGMPLHSATVTDGDLGTTGTAARNAAPESSEPGRSELRSARDGDLLRGPGLDRMSIDLSDEGLGPLTLQAAAGAGGLHLRLAAGDRAIGEALADAADQLRRDLEAGGTRLGSLDVGHRDARSGSGFSAPRQQPSSATSDTASIGVAATQLIPARGSTGGSVPSGLDLMI